MASWVWAFNPSQNALQGRAGEGLLLDALNCTTDRHGMALCCIEHPLAVDTMSRLGSGFLGRAAIMQMFNGSLMN